MNIGNKIPSVNFKYRVRTDGNDLLYTNDGPENPFEWKDVSTEDIFAGKRVIIFSLPGAFTPTCSTLQVPHYEQDYDLLKSFGVDEIYVVSVNDTFVMRKWMIDQRIKNLKFIPDGAGEFTQKMGMLVCKDHLGFGNRSWRYSAVIDNGVVEQFFQEPGINQTGEDNDPYGQTSPETMYQYLSENKNSN